MLFKKILLSLIAFNIAVFTLFSFNLEVHAAYSKVATATAKKVAKELVTDSAVNLALEIVMEYEMRDSDKNKFKQTETGFVAVCLDETPVQNCNNPAQIKKELTDIDKSNVANSVETLLDQRSGSTGFTKFLDWFIPIFLIGTAVTWLTTVLDDDTDDLFDDIAKQSLINNDLLKPLPSNYLQLTDNSFLQRNLTVDLMSGGKNSAENTNTTGLVQYRLRGTGEEGHTTFNSLRNNVSDATGIKSFYFDQKAGGDHYMYYHYLAFANTEIDEYGRDSFDTWDDYLAEFQLFIFFDDIVLHSFDATGSTKVEAELSFDGGPYQPMTKDLFKPGIKGWYYDMMIMPRDTYLAYRNKNNIISPLNIREIHVLPKRVVDVGVSETEIIIRMYSGHDIHIKARAFNNDTSPKYYDRVSFFQYQYVDGIVDVFMQIDVHNGEDYLLSPKPVIKPVTPPAIAPNAIDTSVYKRQDGSVNILPPSAVPITTTLFGDDLYVQPVPSPVPNPSPQTLPSWQDVTTKQPSSITDDDLVVHDPIVTPDGSFTIVGNGETLPKPTPDPDSDKPTDSPPITEDDFDDLSCARPKKIDFEPLTNSFTNAFPFSIPWDLKNMVDNAFGSVGDSKPTYNLTFLGENVVLTMPQMIDDWMPFFRGVLIVLFDISVIYVFYRFMRGGS